MKATVVAALLCFLLETSVCSTRNSLLDDSKFRDFLEQDRKALPENTESSCQLHQCDPGNCIEVLGRPTCLCPETYKEVDGKCVEKRCAEPLLCWPGKCIVKNNKERCLCPEGYISSSGLCNRIDQKCKRPLNCLPGQCVSTNGKETCLCPPGYLSERGYCKVMGNSLFNEGKCYNRNCDPGKCIMENNKEICLCPSGYMAKEDSCMEITTNPGKMSTIMMMIIVAAASAILTILIGLTICCIYCPRRL